MDLGTNENELHYLNSNGRNPSPHRHRITIFFVLLILGILILWVILMREPTALTVQVVDQITGSAVPRATVILLVEGKSFRALSDSDGLVTFPNLPTSEEKANLIVETEQYQVYDATLSLPVTEFRVGLENKNPLGGKIIVRVLDDRDSSAVVGAVVVLFVEGIGEVRSQPTDNNGITRFNIDFQPETGKADVDIRVEAAGFEINQQRVTLIVNTLQDIRLNPFNSEFMVTYPGSDNLISTDIPTATSAATNTSTTLQMAFNDETEWTNGIVTLRISERTYNKTWSVGAIAYRFVLGLVMQYENNSGDVIVLGFDQGTFSLTDNLGRDYPCTFSTGGHFSGTVSGTTVENTKTLTFNVGCGRNGAIDGDVNAFTFSVRDFSSLGDANWLFEVQR